MPGSDDSSELDNVLNRLEAELDEPSEDQATRGLPADFRADSDATRKYQIATPSEITEVFDTEEPTSVTLAEVEPTDAFQAPEPHPVESIVARSDDLAAILFEDEDIEEETRFFERMYASEAEQLERGQFPTVDDVIANLYRVETVRKPQVSYVVLHQGVHERFELRLLPGVGRDSVEDARIRNLAKRASVLGHDAIGFVTDVGFCRRFGMYAVCEYVRGEGIDDLTRTGERLHLDAALEFAYQIGGALSAMHDVGLVHGFREYDAVIRALDGAWKLVRPGFPTGEVSPFTAPEVVDERLVVAASDQFALASIFYTLLIGVAPEGESPFAPSELRSDLPAEVDAPILRALHQEVDQRWPSIDDFLEAIQAAIQVWRAPTVDPFIGRQDSRIMQAAAILKPRTMEKSRKPTPEPEPEPASASAPEPEPEPDPAIVEPSDPQPEPVPESEPQVEVKEPEAALFGFGAPQKRSVIIRIEDLQTERLDVEMNFQSAERLRREYRRNILAAGLFLPMADPPTPPHLVSLTMRYQPTGQSLTVDANLVSASPGSDTSPPGAGLVFDPTNHARILDFLRTLNLGLGLKPTDVIVVQRALSQNDDLSSGEAFLMSRLAHEMTVGVARGSFTGLPFDFDETIGSLLERGFLVTRPADPKANVSPSRPVHRAPRGSLRPQGGSHRDSVNATLSTGQFQKMKDAQEEAKRRPPAPAEAPKAPVEPIDPPPESIKQQVPVPMLESSSSSLESASIAIERFELSDEDEGQILEIVDYFEEQKNFISAIDLLERSLEQGSQHPRLHHRLAILRARFQNDLVGAINAINRALRLEPQNKDFRATRHYIKSLQSIEAQRPIFQQSLPGAEVYFLRVEPDLNRVWLEVASTVPKTERRIFAVDYQRARLHGVIHADHPESMRAVPGNHPRLMVFDRKVPTRMKTIRERRLKLLEVARSASDFGPWFREGGRPIACSSNSSFLVLEEIAGTLDRGLYLVNESGTSVPLKLDEGSTRSHSPSFSVDDAYVAWVTVKPKRGVYVAPCLQVANRVYEPDSDVAICWGRDETLYILELAQGRIKQTSVKGGVRDLADFKQAFDGWTHDCEHRTVLLHRRSTSSTKLIWVDLKSGETKATYEAPVEMDELILREDGLVFGRTADGGIGIDMKRGRHHVLEGIQVAEGSVSRNMWTVGQPLVVLSVAPDMLELLALNIPLLVNS